MFTNFCRAAGSLVTKRQTGKRLLSSFKNMNLVKTNECTTYDVTLNIKLSSKFMLPVKSDDVMKIDLSEPRPLVVVLEYMKAKKKHMKKIADVYFDWGFDVLQVFITPFQLLYPKTGSQVVAYHLAQFLVTNKMYSPLIIHGFSIGGYLWGETLIWFQSDIEKYQPVLDRIKGQIFDSPADLDAMPTAFPASLFPNNALLRSTLQKYLRFHLKFNHETVTKHYIKSRKTFSSGIVKAPTFFITSYSDILSTPESVLKVKDEILEQGLQSYVKVFQGSPHVMHFKTYPNEYIADVKAFLKMIGQPLLDISVASKL